MNKRASVTIEDVAKVAGVSRQTVSRVINAKPGVKRAVRERIEKAIADLGYVPNLAARRMGGARSFLVIAILDRQRTIENWSAGRGTDWIDQMLFGGMLACEQRGYSMFFELVDTDPTEAVRHVRRVLSSLQPDGVILTQPHIDNAELVQLLDERGCPFVRIGQPSGEIEAVSIHMDERGAAKAATDYLIALGHERIGFLSGGLCDSGSRLRLEGYVAAMQGIGDGPLNEAADSSFDRANVVAHAWLSSSNPPTAIIAENDEMAFAVLHVADQLSIEVPKRLSLISFEDTPGVRFSVPPLTAIRQPTADMISRACNILMDAAEGKACECEPMLPLRMIERNTTGPAPR